MEMAVMFGRPWGPTAMDDGFEHEVWAAEEVGMESWAIPLDPVVNEAPERALERLPPPAGRRWLYRGWMLSVDEYEALFEAVLDRGETMVVDPTAFEEAAYVPCWAPRLEGHTAATRWIEGADADEAWEAACSLGPPPWLLKDHVKSVKERWLEACFVPAGIDRDGFRRRVDALVDHRGDRFERGIVIRAFLDLAPTGYGAGGRMVPDEHRLVFWEGALVAHAPYHDVDGQLPEPEGFAHLGERIRSPFFTADVACLSTGDWTVIEINDGGSSTLPDQLDPRALYRAVAASEVA